MIATSTEGLLDVRLLYTDGCPATPETVELIGEVAASVGTLYHLERVLVETPEQALALKFLGSPTVQVNDLDIDPAARKNTDFGFT